jgi:hypothetical protein
LDEQRTNTNQTSGVDPSRSGEIGEAQPGKAGCCGALYNWVAASVLCLLVAQPVACYHAYVKGHSPYWVGESASSLALILFVLAVALANAIPCFTIGSIMHMTSREETGILSTASGKLGLLFGMVALWAIGFAGVGFNLNSHHWHALGYRDWLRDSVDIVQLRESLLKGEPAGLSVIGSDAYPPPIKELQPDNVFWPRGTGNKWGALVWEINGDPRYRLMVAVPGNEIPDYRPNRGSTLDVTQDAKVWMRW